MTCLAFSRWPPVILALPVSQPPSMRHSASSSGPAARWMAPSTPPPPSSERLAALTIAPTSSVVMSATRISSRVSPISALSNGGAAAFMADSLSRPLGADFGLQIDSAAHADVVEMRVEESPRRALPVGAQHLEEIVVGVEAAVRVELLGGGIERDPAHVDAPILAGAPARASGGPDRSTASRIRWRAAHP